MELKYWKPKLIPSLLGSHSLWQCGGRHCSQAGRERKALRWKLIGLYVYTGHFKKQIIMHPVSFDGAVEIKKPDNMTDEQCISAWAKFGFSNLLDLFKSKKVLPPAFYEYVDSTGYQHFTTAWQPNKEDLEPLNRGEPIYIQTLSRQLPPMSVFTLDEKGSGNF